MKKLLAFMVLALAMLVTSGCSREGANSSSWTNTVNHSERSVEGSFTINIGSARRGHRNRTYFLSADELDAIHIESASAEGEILLILSQDGQAGTELQFDISNFTGYLAGVRLHPGNIRFSLRFSDIRDSVTTISWAPPPETGEFTYDVYFEDVYGYD